MIRYTYSLLLLGLLLLISSCADKGPLRVDTAAQVGLSFSFQQRSELPPEFTAKVMLSGEKIRERVFNVKIVDYVDYHKCVDPIEVPMHKDIYMIVTAEIDGVEWVGHTDELFLSPGNTKNIVIFMIPSPR